MEKKFYESPQIEVVRLYINNHVMLTVSETDPDLPADAPEWKGNIWDDDDDEAW